MHSRAFCTSREFGTLARRAVVSLCTVLWFGLVWAWAAVVPLGRDLLSMFFHNPIVLGSAAKRILYVKKN